MHCYIMQYCLPIILLCKDFNMLISAIVKNIRGSHEHELAVAFFFCVKKLKAFFPVIAVIASRLEDSDIACSV